jgi:hypothetical protein
MPPARVFRYTYTNNTNTLVVKDGIQVENKHTLQRVDHHCCSGVFTSNDWEPTLNVPPAGTGGLQGESKGVLTGTVGWAKYNIVRDSDNATRGMLFLSWDNPYFGATQFSFGLVGPRGIPLCDQEGADDTSSYGDANSPPSDVDVVCTLIRKNGAPTDIDDWGEVYRVPLAPVWIFGAGQIWERMEIELSFFSKSEGAPMTLPGVGQKSRTLDASPSPQALSGTWVGGQTTVTISYVGYRLFKVDISDLTPGRQLVDSTTCSLGAAGVVSMFEQTTSTLRSMITAGDVAHSPVEMGKAAVALAGVTAALRASADDTSGVSWLGLSRTRKMSAAQISEIARSYHVADSPILRQIAIAGAANLNHSDYTLYPGHGIALQLYYELENGRPHGYSLHYQRLTEVGSVLADEFLMPQISVH